MNNEMTMIISRMHVVVWRHIKMTENENLWEMKMEKDSNRKSKPCEEILTRNDLIKFQPSEIRIDWRFTFIHVRFAINTM